MGIENFLANSKSRSSCAGTAITAPVPYEAITKFPLQMGILSPVSGCMAFLPSGTPCFLFMFFIRSNSAIIETSSCSFCQAGSKSVPVTNSLASGCSGANVMNVAPNKVSGRVVNTVIVLSESSISNIISAPSERPNQSFCMAATFSGNSIVSRPSTSSWAYFGISKNH